MWSIGPRQVIAWSRSDRKNSIEITFTPPCASSGMILRSRRHARPAVHAEHARDRVAPDVGVERGGGVALGLKRGGEVGGQRGLAHAALARRHADHVLHRRRARPRAARPAGRAAARGPASRRRSARRTPPVTRLTPSSAVTFSITAFSKWERIGQPGVVSETHHVDAAVAPAARSKRTIPSVTMSLRSSGSMTRRRASRICVSEGMRLDCRRRTAPPPPPTGPKDRRRPGEAPSAEGGEILHCRVCRQPHPGAGLSNRPGGSGAVLGDARSRVREAIGLALRLAAGRLDLTLDVAARHLDLRLGVPAHRLQRPDGLGAALAQLALDARAGALDLADGRLRAVVPRRSNLRRLVDDALLELVELLLGAVTALV